MDSEITWLGARFQDLAVVGRRFHVEGRCVDVSSSFQALGSVLSTN